MNEYHRRAYLKHFEGYTEIRDPASGKIQRVYTSRYFQCDLSDHLLRRRKWRYAVMLLISIGIWIAVSLSGLPGTATKYVSLSIALTIPPLFFAVISAVNFSTAPRKMTVCEYRSSSLRLRNSALAAAIALLSSGIGESVFVFTHFHDFIWQEIAGICGYLIAATIMSLLFKAEWMTNYLRVPNENSSLSGEDGATEILW